MSALYAVVAQPGLCHHVGEYVGVDDKVSMIVALGRGGDANDNVQTYFDTLFPPADRDPTAAHRAHMSATNSSITNLNDNVASFEFIVRDQRHQLEEALCRTESATRERDKMASELAAKNKMLEDVISASRKAYGRSASKCTRSSCANWEPTYDPINGRTGRFGSCTLCDMAKYCSEECQTADWKCHKKKCLGHRKCSGVYNWGNEDADDILGMTRSQLLETVRRYAELAGDRLVIAMLEREDGEEEDEEDSSDDDDDSLSALPALDGGAYEHLDDELAWHVQRLSDARGRAVLEEATRLTGRERGGDLFVFRDGGEVETDGDGDGGGLELVD